MRLRPIRMISHYGAPTDRFHVIEVRLAPRRYSESQWDIFIYVGPLHKRLRRYAIDTLPSFYAALSAISYITANYLNDDYSLAQENLKSRRALVL